MKEEDAAEEEDQGEFKKEIKEENFQQNIIMAPRVGRGCNLPPKVVLDCPNPNCSPYDFEEEPFRPKNDDDGDCSRVLKLHAGGGGGGAAGGGGAGGGRRRRRRRWRRRGLQTPAAGDISRITRRCWRSGVLTASVLVPVSAIRFGQHDVDSRMIFMHDEDGHTLPFHYRRSLYETLDIKKRCEGVSG